jgi:hypothetical protein
MADFIAGRSPDTPEADALRGVATALRAAPAAVVDPGFMAALVHSFAVSDWSAAADEAQRLSLLASDASLAVNWSVFAALCLIRAGRVGADLEHTARVMLARCSALRPVRSAVKVWAVDLLAASHASQGRLHDLLATVSAAPTQSPIGRAATGQGDQAAGSVVLRVRRQNDAVDLVIEGTGAGPELVQSGGIVYVDWPRLRLMAVDGPLDCR